MNSRVFLGLAGVVDFETVWDQDKWSALAREFDIALEDLAFSGPVNDRREAVRAVLSMIAESRGNEIRVEDPEVSFWLGEVLDHRVTIGGTNFRSAAILGQLGISSIAQVSAVDDVMESLVPAGCSVLAAKRAQRLTPNIIVQYPKGAKIRLRDGSVTANRSDRVILANDENIQHPMFPERMKRVLADAPLAMISSLNAMADEDELQELLVQLVDALENRRADSVFMWEDAGYHRPDFQETVAKTIAPLVDIFSTNIEEAKSLTGRETDIWDPDSISLTLTALQELLQARNVVVHCEGWAAVRGPDAARIIPALEKGQAVSSARFAKGDNATPKDYEHLMDAGPLMGPEGFKQLVESHDTETKIALSYDVESSGPVTIGLGDAFVGGVLAQLWQQMDGKPSDD